MKHLYGILILVFILAGSAKAQIGVGATGAVQYPGFFESDKYGSQFRIGPGYGFFIRHDLFSLADTYAFHARYKVKFFFHDINLPKAGSTRYKFDHFSVDVWADVYTKMKWNIYSGVSLNLLNVTGSSKYRSDYTGTQILPVLMTGVEYNVTESYSIFSELFLQFAEIDAGPEPLPISGLGLLLGVTMYISE
jgi:hypothetical protein